MSLRGNKETSDDYDTQSFNPHYRDAGDNDDASLPSDDTLYEFIQFRSHRNSYGLEEYISFSYPGTNRTITLSTKLKEDDLAPLFDGASWAGTRVWSASIFGIKFLVDNYKDSIAEKVICELGSGLGVPGMVLHLMGGMVVVTEQERIMSQLTSNVKSNFPDSFGLCDQTNCLVTGRRPGIITQPFTWSRNGLQSLLVETGFKNGFDIVLNCDCIFEPLYGKSWESLADVIDECFRINPKCMVITSVERRASDGIDDFLCRLRQYDSVREVELVSADISETRKLELYVARGI